MRFTAGFAVGALASCLILWQFWIRYLGPTTLRIAAISRHVYERIEAEA